MAYIVYELITAYEMIMKVNRTVYVELKLRRVLTVKYPIILLVFVKVIESDPDPVQNIEFGYPSKTGTCRYA
jgi:hypothetical protein